MGKISTSLRYGIDITETDRLSWRVEGPRNSDVLNPGKIQFHRGDLTYFDLILLLRRIASAEVTGLQRRQSSPSSPIQG